MADNPARETLIRCYIQHRISCGACAGLMLNLNDRAYLWRFASIYSDRLPIEYTTRAVDAVAEHQNPGTLFLMFATMANDAQQHCAAQVAKHIINIGNEYYVGKFANYIYEIARLESPLLGHTLIGNGIDRDYARRWSTNLDESNLQQLALIHEDYAATGLPYVSPDKHIIKNREGHEASIVVLHSSGPGTKPSGIALHCMQQTGAVPISAHYIISCAGQVYQFVDLKDAARTNATSTDPTADNYYRFARHDFFRSSPVNANNFCVTIECEESGRHGAIETDSPQYMAILKTLALINQETGIPIDAYHVIGHGDIAPLSKWFCPGSEFPIKSLIDDFRKIGSRLPVAKPLAPESIIKK